MDDAYDVTVVVDRQPEPVAAEGAAAKEPHAPIRGSIFHAVRQGWRVCARWICTSTGAFKKI